jgi:hypothetical protein
MKQTVNRDQLDVVCKNRECRKADIVIECKVDTNRRGRTIRPGSQCPALYKL